jgi:hypothetical protein
MLKDVLLCSLGLFPEGLYLSIKLHGVNPLNVKVFFTTEDLKCVAENYLT